MRVPFISELRSRRSGRPMTCAEVGKLLQRYLDGHLDPPRGARLHAHLEDCRRCGLEADTYERIKTSLAGDAFPVPEDSLARLREFGDRLVRGDEPIGL
jgi:predicted anti-sigma-YlaC factor YlaD